MDNEQREKGAHGLVGVNGTERIKKEKKTNSKETGKIVNSVIVSLPI